MSGSIEYGKCDICGKNGPLERKAYYYNLKCTCHSPQHFVIVSHCKDCTPKPPKEIKVFLNGSEYLEE